MPGTYYPDYKMAIKFATVKGNSYYYRCRAVTATTRHMLAATTVDKPKDAANTLEMV